MSSSSKRSRESDASSPAETPQKSIAQSTTSPTKADDNTNINSLSLSEIDNVVVMMFTKKYERSTKGRRSSEMSKLTYPVPYLLRKSGHLFANPYAFGWTKNVSWIGHELPPPKGVGYPTIKVQRTNGEWLERIPLHSLLYRYHTRQQITNQVSHLRDNPLLVTPDELLDEEGVYQRARTCCIKYEWYRPMPCGHPKCGHEPSCLPPLTAEESPSWADYADASRDTLGE